MMCTLNEKVKELGVTLVAFVTLVVVGVAGVIILEDPAERIIAVILIIMIGVVMGFIPRKDAPGKHIFFYLITQTVLVAGLLVLEGGWGMFPILYFVLSPQAMMLLPARKGFWWILLFAILTGLTAIRAEGLASGAISFLGYGAGFFFFGMFGYTLNQAEVERKKSEALLKDLEETHEQLQEYVLRVEELAVAEERNRLAREMHDAIGHRLTVSAVQLEGAQRLIPDDPNRAVEMVATVREQVREALSELRRTVARMRMPLESGLSLAQALERLVSSFEEATQLPVNILLPEDMPDLPENHRLAIFRITQEALTNIQRHAQARQVWLQIHCQDEQVQLLVGDDGPGFPDEAEQIGFGLRGIRERVSQLGGKFYLEERPGGGGQLSISLPLSGENADA